MRTVAAELRAAGEMPAPAHFGLLSILSVRPRMLTRPRLAAGRQPADDVQLDQRDGRARLGAARGAGRRPPRRDDRRDRRPAAPRSNASAARPKRTWPTCWRRSICPPGGGCVGGLGRAAQGVRRSAGRDVTQESQNTGEAIVVCILDSKRGTCDADHDGRIGDRPGEKPAGALRRHPVRAARDLRGRRRASALARHLPDRLPDHGVGGDRAACPPRSDATPSSISRFPRPNRTGGRLTAGPDRPAREDSRRTRLRRAGHSAALPRRSAAC